jgi:hypothetical protein
MKEEIYIGTKIIAAEPMNDVVFAETVHPGRVITGVTKEKPRKGYKVRCEDGYVSWIPKETFERAYRKVTSEEGAMISVQYDLKN